MRDSVAIQFGRREYRLLPTFGAMDAFEDRCGALTAHLLNLTSGTATLKTRATLVYHGMKAAFDNEGKSTQDLSVQSTMQAMFDAGAADNDLMLKEVEFIERLLFTPEQYQAKKEAREKAEAMQTDLMNLLHASPGYSASPQPFSDGNLPSSGAQRPESSLPA
jgi:hypothetical protein